MSLSLRDLVAPLFRRRRVLMLTFLSVFSVTTLLGWMYLHKNGSQRKIAAAALTMNQAALQDADAGLRALGMSGAPAEGAASAASFADADLEGEARIDEQSYLRYLSQREQTRAAMRIAVPATSRAAGMPGPVSMVAIAFASAIFASLLLGYLTDSCDPSFHTPDQVVEFLKIPLVIAVPKRMV